MTDPCWLIWWFTSEYSKWSLLWQIAGQKRKEVQNQLLVLVLEFIKKKMVTSMDKQIAYTDKSGIPLYPPKLSYCAGFVKLAEFEVATESKEEKRPTQLQDCCVRWLYKSLKCSNVFQIPLFCLSILKPSLFQSTNK